MHIRNIGKIIYAACIGTAILNIAVIFLIGCGITGCEILKNKKSLNQETTGVSKKETFAIDTSNGGSVKKNETKTKEEFDWYRLTQMFDNNKQQPGDTKVYPTAVIYEGGKGSKEQTSNTSDSNWFKNAIGLLTKQVDSLNSKLSSKEKDIQSETKGVGLVMVIFIVAGFFVLYMLGKYFFGKFKIIKS